MRTMVQYRRPTDSCTLALVREAEQGIYRQRRPRPGGDSDVVLRGKIGRPALHYSWTPGTLARVESVDRYTCHMSTTTQRLWLDKC